MPPVEVAGQLDTFSTPRRARRKNVFIHVRPAAGAVITKKPALALCAAAESFLGVAFCL
jgi:hypothetical protein